MIIKRVEDHNIIKSNTCGNIHEILTDEDYDSLSIAVLPDSQPTKGHYHEKFEEIYFVLDGSVTIKFYDPDSGNTWNEKLKANELCIIPKGIHHVIEETSPGNRLCVMCLPRFVDGDLKPSEVLGGTD